MTSPPPLPPANPDEQVVWREVVGVFLQTYGRGVAWSGFSRFLVTVLSAVGLGHQHAWSGSSARVVSVTILIAWLLLEIHCTSLEVALHHEVNGTVIWCKYY